MITFEEKLIKLTEKIKCSYNKIDENKYIINFFNNYSVDVIKTDDFLFIISNIIPLKEENREIILTHVMKANLLKEGTGKNIIGIDDGEKFLTLSSKIAYEENIIIDDLEDILEEFLNYLLFWEEELNKILEKQSKSIY